MAEEKFGYEGFQTTAEVVQLYREIESLVTGGAGRQGNAPLLQTIKQNEANRLEALYKKALTIESNFYKSKGLKGDFKDLYKKAQYWSRSVGGVDNFQKNLQLIKDLRNVATELVQSNADEVIMQATDVLTNEEWLEIVRPFLSEEIDPAIVENLGDTAIGSRSSKSGMVKVTMKGVSNKKKIYESLNGITIHYTADGNLEIRFTKAISSNIQKKIQDKILQKAKKHEKEIIANNRPQIAQKMLEIIRNHLPNITNRAMSIITNIIDKYWTKESAIQIGDNSALVRGFLGEVYWTAFFTYIGFDAIPAGVTLKSGNVEVPTDVVLDGLGFQVKNYTAVDGVVTFNQHLNRQTGTMESNQIGLYNFFTSPTKLGLTDQDASTFGKFFFSFYYNKRNEEKDKKGAFSPIETYAAGLKQNVMSYVEANAIKLLNMDGNIELDNTESLSLFNLPPDFEAGKPAFYLINGEPIPASEIIYDVMQSLKEVNDHTALINVQNVFLDISTFNPGHVWDEGTGKADNIITNALGQPRKKGTAYISYKIDMNIEGLVDRILKRAKQK